MKYYYFSFNADKPRPPTNLHITEITPETVTVVWEPPTDDGGSPVTRYVIEKRDMKRPTWTNAGTVTDTELSFTVPKLFEGNEYLFRVSAVNKHGQGEPVETSEPVTAKHQFGRSICPISYSLQLRHGDSLIIKLASTGEVMTQEVSRVKLQKIAAD